MLRGGATKSNCIVREVAVLSRRMSGVDMKTFALKLLVAYIITIVLYSLTLVVRFGYHGIMVYVAVIPFFGVLVAEFFISFWEKKKFSVGISLIAILASYLIAFVLYNASESLLPTERGDRDLLFKVTWFLSQPFLVILIYEKVWDIFFKEKKDS